jgi:Tfp pilus assembly protein PilV
MPILHGHTQRASCKDNPGTKGFTLLEVLRDAVAADSVGMLGIAHRCTSRAGAAASAGWHCTGTQAVTLAADLADRIRANRDPARHL